MMSELLVFGIALLCMGLLLNALYLLLPHRYIVNAGVLSASASIWQSLKMKCAIQPDAMTSFAVKLLLLGFLCDGCAIVLLFLAQHVV